MRCKIVSDTFTYVVCACKIMRYQKIWFLYLEYWITLIFILMMKYKDSKLSIQYFNDEDEYYTTAWNGWKNLTLKK